MDSILASPWVSSIFFKMALTLVLGFVFGYERQKSRKPIGFGTFIFVSVGACSLAIIAQRLTGQNTVPLLAAIVTGIGFLGAGALIKTGEKIHGFTSAALIWLFAIFGLSIGGGEIVLGLTIYVIIWIVSLVDNILQNKGMGAYKKQLRVTVQLDDRDTPSYVSTLRELDCRLVSIVSDRESQTKTYVYDISLSGENIIELTDTIGSIPTVIRIELE